MQIENLTADDLVQTIDGLIDQDKLPVGYFFDLMDAIQRYQASEYDLEPDEHARPVDIHPKALLRLSYLLFGLRVLNFELIQKFRNENFKDGVSDLDAYRRTLEGICKRFDKTYKSELQTIYSPSLDSSFWYQRGQTTPVDAMRMFIRSY